MLLDWMAHIMIVKQVLSRGHDAQNNLSIVWQALHSQCVYYCFLFSYNCFQSIRDMKHDVCVVQLTLQIKNHRKAALEMGSIGDFKLTDPCLKKLCRPAKFGGKTIKCHLLNSTQFPEWRTWLPIRHEPCSSTDRAGWRIRRVCQWKSVTWGCLYTLGYPLVSVVVQPYFGT